MRHHFQGYLLGLIFMLVLAGCQGQATPTPTATLVPPSPTFIVVTRTPLPSATPTPLPGFLKTSVGNWILNLKYRLLNGPIFNDIWFTGSAEINVNAVGAVTGHIVFYGTTTNTMCLASLKDKAPHEASIEGALSGAADGTVLANLTLIPTNPNQTSTLIIACQDSNNFSYTLNQPLLWPMLRVVNGFNISIPFGAGSSMSYVRDLTGPSQGSLYGMLSVQMSITHP